MDVRLTAGHSLRPPKWRYQRARDVLLKQGRPRCGEGKDLWWDFWRFLRKLVACHDAPSRRRLMREAREFWFAMEIYGEVGSGLRATIEARLLAGQSPSEIAARAGFSPGIIQAYADIFFDVLDRLPSPDLIRAVVFQGQRRFSGNLAEGGVALQEIGYYGGPDLLNHVLQTPQPPVNPEMDQRTLEQIAQQLESLLRARMIAGMSGVDTIDENAIQRWTRLLAQLQAVRQATGNSSPGEEAYLKNVKAVMDSVPWELATQKKLPDEFKPYEKSAMELRADEMVALAAGLEGPDPKTMRLRLLPAGSKIPKPPSK